MKTMEKRYGVSMYRCLWCHSIYGCDWGKCGNCGLICPPIDQIEIIDFCPRCKPKNQEEENEIRNYMRTVQKAPDIPTRHSRHCCDSMPILRKPQQCFEDDN